MKQVRYGAYADCACNAANLTVIKKAIVKPMCVVCTLRKTIPRSMQKVISTHIKNKNFHFVPNNQFPYSQLRSFLIVQILDQIQCCIIQINIIENYMSKGLKSFAMSRYSTKETVKMINTRHGTVFYLSSLVSPWPQNKTTCSPQTVTHI